jgi:hypothetical protein
MNAQLISIALFLPTLLLAATAWSQALSSQVNTDQANLVRLPPSSILCIDDDATGFNWRNKKWVQTNFNSGSKFIIRKIEIDKYIKRDDRSKNNLLLCEDPNIWDVTQGKNKFSGSINACYEIKVMGEKGNALDSRSCSEWWQDGRLEKISCRDHTPQTFFKPDGSFIRYPWHSDLSQSTEKASLHISVGTCSTIN